jgi:hypothetical protein
MMFSGCPSVSKILFDEWYGSADNDLVEVDRVTGSYSSSVEVLSNIANTLFDASYNGIFSPWYH